ncbi:MAG: hypothetical protein AAFR70_10190 [Pseudomonadota bacterium]
MRGYGLGFKIDERLRLELDLQVVAATESQDWWVPEWRVPERRV